MTKVKAPAPPGPYRGIRPFRFVDRQNYFGRKELIEELLTKVLLYRLVVLFGESGAGKSSLLNAGLIPALMGKGFRPERLRVRPFEDGPVLVERIHSGAAEGDLLPSAFDRGEGRRATGGAQDDGLLYSLKDFSATLRPNAPAGPAAAHGRTEPVLLFDQFEELFTLFGQEGGRSLRGESALQRRLLEAILGIICDPTLRVKVVIVIREDFLGKLEVLAKEYPQVFDRRIRLGLLDGAQARAAILNPFGVRFSRGRRNAVPAVRKPSPPTPLPTPLPTNRFASRLTGELADEIVRQLSDAQPGVMSPPTQLQIICSSLWDAYAATKPQIGLGEFETMGGVRGILEKFLKAEVASVGPSLRWSPVKILGQLVTTSGTRDVVSIDKLTESMNLYEQGGAGRFRLSNLLPLYLRGVFGWGEVSKEELERAMTVLEGRRLVNKVSQRQTDYYELSSEFLIEPIQKERDRFNLAHERRQKNVVFALALVLVAAAAGFTYWYGQTATREGLAKYTAEQLEEEDTLKKQTEFRQNAIKVIRAVETLNVGNEATRRQAVAELEQVAKDDPELIPLVRETIQKYTPGAAQRIEQTADASRVFIHITDGKQRDAANKIKSELEKQGVVVPSVQKVTVGPDGTELRYFRNDEAVVREAERVAQLIRGAGLANLTAQYVPGYEDSPSVKPNQFELWFAYDKKIEEGTALIIKVDGGATIWRGDNILDARVGMTVVEDDVFYLGDKSRLGLRCSNGSIRTLRPVEGGVGQEFPCP